MVVVCVLSPCVCAHVRVSEIVHMHVNERGERVSCCLLQASLPLLLSSVTNRCFCYTFASSVLICTRTDLHLISFNQ